MDGKCTHLQPINEASCFCIFVGWHLSWRVGEIVPWYYHYCMQPSYLSDLSISWYANSWNAFRNSIDQYLANKWSACLVYKLNAIRSSLFTMLLATKDRVLGINGTLKALLKGRDGCDRCFPIITSPPIAPFSITKMLTMSVFMAEISRNDSDHEYNEYLTNVTSTVTSWPLSIPSTSNRWLHVEDV